MTKEFSRWLRGQMDRREWGVTRMARELGVNHGIVSQWLSGDRNPSPASLDLIADKLVANYDELLTLAGHRPKGLDEIDPDSPVGRLCAKLRRVDWSDPQREPLVNAILTQMLEFDRSQRKEA